MCTGSGRRAAGTGGKGAGAVPPNLGTETDAQTPEAQIPTENAYKETHAETLSLSRQHERQGGVLRQQEKNNLGHTRKNISRFLSRKTVQAGDQGNVFKVPKEPKCR